MRQEVIMLCILGIEKPCNGCGICGWEGTWNYKMAECRYPGKACTHMVLFKGDVYCGSVPCTVKDKIQKDTNTGRHIKKIKAGKKV